MSLIEAGIDALGEMILASGGDVEGAFEQVLREVGGFSAPASWIDTPQEDLEYTLRELEPDMRAMRDALMELKSELASRGITISTSEESDLDAWIDDLNRDLAGLQKIKNAADPTVFYPGLEKLGGAWGFYNYEVDRQNQIGELVSSLRDTYHASRNA